MKKVRHLEGRDEAGPVTYLAGLLAASRKADSVVMSTRRCSGGGYRAEAAAARSLEHGLELCAPFDGSDLGLTGLPHVLGRGSGE